MELQETPQMDCNSLYAVNILSVHLPIMPKCSNMKLFVLGNGLQWFVCRKYIQRVFANHAEIYQHETLCIGMIDHQFHGSNMCVESLSDHHPAHESHYPVINIHTTLQNSSSQHNLTGPNKKEGENNTKKPES